jgi:hypothetical protein
MSEIMLIPVVDDRPANTALHRPVDPFKHPAEALVQRVSSQEGPVLRKLLRSAR